MFPVKGTFVLPDTMKMTKHGKHYGNKLKCISLFLCQQRLFHRKHRRFKEINITINYTM